MLQMQIALERCLLVMDIVKQLFLRLAMEKRAFYLACPRQTDGGETLCDAECVFRPRTRVRVIIDSS
jgi:hypothetical protein